MKKHVDDKCVFRPPTYFTPWTGKDEFLMLIAAVSEVFGPSFKYGRQWISDDGKDWCLEFTAKIGDDTDGKAPLLHGVDLVKLDDKGNIVDFAVLARPPNAVSKLKEEMMKVSSKF